MDDPQRGFPHSEFRTRLARAQQAMARAGLDALLLTTHPDLYYFTGYLTRFWESPTRPWFLILPQSGEPIAVIPSIGAPLMATTWITDIRTWPAPDLADDGVSLLADTFAEFLPQGRVGVPDGHETHLRMPLADFDKLKRLLTGISLVGDAGIVAQLRMLKSDAEIAKITHACAIAGRAFARVPDIMPRVDTLEALFRRFQILGLEEGADWVAYLAGGTGRHGYRDVISPASSKPLVEGDVLMLDTGLVWDGYFCDYDRNFSIGKPAEDMANANTQLIEATMAGFEAARPGLRACDVFDAMQQILSAGKAKPLGGRFGHGLGIELTEPPSLMPADQTVLQPGMVLTLEPGLATGDGCMLVHEENIVVAQSGARFLTTLADRKLSEVAIGS